MADLVACEVVGHIARNGGLASIDIKLDDDSLVRIATGKTATPDTHALLEAMDWRVVDGRLTPIGATQWRQPIPGARTLDSALRALIKDSWHDKLILKTNSSEGDGTGLRRPQVGALHAIAAHWSIRNSPGLVVMPTGTGKTDTMIAAMVMRAPRRTLVLVPSDVLRTQLSEKFQTLGILRAAGVLGDRAANPVVGIPLSSATFSEEMETLRWCNVVISTVAMIDRSSDEDLLSFLKLFDVVFVDEVHHAPAASWRRILDKAADCSLIGFSATPFREDARRVPGTAIYNFPLKLAQELGYFRKLALVLVDEPDLQRSHFTIAEQAVAALRRDDAMGFMHVILARTSTKKHADKLLAEIYKPHFPDLNPVVLHSGIKGKRKIIEDIHSGLHRIIVCVDMFGEGFDMPSLKIAALHVVHKSLAVTLQFAGRFTRSGPTVGNATIVANIANEQLSPAIEELYAENADWQELLPRLSATAIGNEIQSAEFELTTRAQDLPETSLFDLLSLRPALSVVLFRASSFSATSVMKAIPKDSHLHAQWVSDDGDLVICITRSRRAISWASSKEAADEVWELWLLAYEKEKKLLYLSVSSRSSLHTDFAKRVTNGSAQLIRGEAMFRAFARISRLALYNVGLYGKGRLRFRMFVGRDVAEQITSANQTNNAKSNLFGSGYEDGSRKTIGVSHKGRAWSMDVTTVPEWREWCNTIAGKVVDSTIRTEDYLKHTLNPKSITVLPSLGVLAVMVPDTWMTGDGPVLQIPLSANRMASCQDVYVSAFERHGNALVVTLAYEDEDVLQLQLNWGPGEEEQQFRILSGPTQIFVDGSPQMWADYLVEYSFSVLFIDGSELQGGVHLQRADGQSILFDRAHACAVAWGDTPLDKESKWKAGQRRAKSIQGWWIEELLRGESKIVFDDDDANESADIVEISHNEQAITCRLYHCKYSSGATPGLRIKDIQEVCAQAVRSAKWADIPENLFTHLQLREADGHRGGRPSRFERGTLRELSLLKRLVSKRRFSLHIYVVQPGLSVEQIDRNVSLVLGACDNFVHEITGYPLTVLGSE